MGSSGVLLMTDCSPMSPLYPVSLCDNYSDYIMQIVITVKVDCVMFTIAPTHND